MARPKMKFKPDEAVSLVFELAAKLEDHEFCLNHLVRDPERHSHDGEAAKKALEPIQELARASSRRTLPSEPFPDEGCVLLRDWLSTHLTPEGWTRLQASRRQRSAKLRKSSSFDTREVAVAMPSMAAYYLSKMAEAANLDRKVFADKLVRYLEHDVEGEEVLKRFTQQLLAEQRNKGRQLILDAFGVTPGPDAHVVEQMLVNGLGGPDQVVQAAQTVGKTKLVKLAAWAKKADPNNALRIALTPHAELAGQSPLVALSQGVPLPDPKKKQAVPVQP